MNCINNINKFKNETNKYREICYKKYINYFENVLHLIPHQPFNIVSIIFIVTTFSYKYFVDLKKFYEQTHKRLLILINRNTCVICKLISLLRHNYFTCRALAEDSMYYKIKPQSCRLLSAES